MVAAAVGTMMFVVARLFFTTFSSGHNHTNLQPFFRLLMRQRRTRAAAFWAGVSVLGFLTGMANFLNFSVEVCYTSR